MHYPVSQSPGILRLRLSPSTSAASAPDGGEESVRARLLTPRFSDGLLSKQTPGDAESSPAPFTSAARKHVSPGAYPPPRDRVTTGGRREAPLPRFFHARGESTNIPRAAAPLIPCVRKHTAREIVSWCADANLGKAGKCLARSSCAGLIKERNRKRNVNH